MHAALGPGTSCIAVSTFTRWSVFTQLFIDVVTREASAAVLLFKQAWSALPVYSHLRPA